MGSSLRIGSLALLLGCGASGGADQPALDAGLDTQTDVAVADTPDTPPACTPATCAGAGKSCRKGACVDDCRPKGAGPCSAGTACDFTDGACKDPKAPCFLAGDVFEDCSTKRACGAGTFCDGKGSCIPALAGCRDLDCDDTGRCWGSNCSCDRPAAACTPAKLDDLNRAEFVGALGTDRDSEGAFDLDFDDICTAYVATQISGPDFLRQMTPDGTITEWKSTTNLNMGQVSVLRIPAAEFKTLGDVAATYICCATCGCVETGTDGRLGVIHLDRTSTTRPLPNVLPAKPSSGAGPFGYPVVDTGPYGLVWGADKALYVGNVDVNGDYMRVDLATLAKTKVTTFAARVTASAVFDLQRLLVATEGGKIFVLTTATGTMTDFATLKGDVTSLRRDRFTGRVYAEIRTTPPDIVEVSADGKTVTSFQKAPRLGRITIAPDGWLYHLSVYPAVGWKAKTAVVRWPLPAKR